MLISHPNVNWEEGAPRIVDNLIGYSARKNNEFIKSFLNQIRFGKDEIGKVSEMFTLKDLRQGKLARRAVVCGFIRMLSKPGGAKALKRLIEVVELSKDDPKRIRTIFRLGRFVNLVPIILSTKENNRLSQLRNNVVTKASEKFIDEFSLAVDSRLTKTISMNIENWISSGMFNAYVLLSEKSSQMTSDKTLRALREVCGHVTVGDFGVWRYNHEESLQQLNHLSDEEKVWWTSQTAPVNLLSQPGGNESLTESIRPLFFDLQSHLSFRMIDVESKFNKAVTNHENNPDNANDESLKIWRLRRDINVKCEEIKEYDLTVSPKDNLITIYRQFRQLLLDAGENQSANDAGEIIKLLSVEGLDVRRTFTATETDDVVDLFNSGLYPRETCQSWRSGVYSECLVSTAGDGNKKLVNVMADEAVVGRSLIKTTQLSSISGKNFGAILVEPTYALHANSSINLAVWQLVINKARVKRMPIVSSSKKIPKYLSELLAHEKMTIEEDVVSLESVNPIGQFEYSDTFGGRLTKDTPLETRKVPVNVFRFT